MARSKGPCHSLSVKLGQATAECERLQFRMLSMECVHKKSLATLTNAQVESLRQLHETHRTEIDELKGRLNDVCGLRDLIVRYDDLVLALFPAHPIKTSLQKCLETLQASLFEAADGLGVKRA